MTTTSSSKSAFAALIFASAAAGCSAFAGDSDDPEVSQDQSLPPRPDTAPAAPPTAETAANTPPPPPPVVAGPADNSELTNALGVFVAPTGLANAAGTREHPLASIQAGIELAKRTNKSVYVCTGTYGEALIIANAISIIGALDCSNGDWRLGGKPSRVESPSSPAVRATNITSPTLIQGLDINAPNASTPSSSSIGLIAVQSNALAITDSKITANNGTKGADGTDGTQLANGPTTNGLAQIPVGNVTAGGLPWYYNQFGGTNACGGGAHAAESGGYGGVGGLSKVVYVAPGNWQFRVDPNATEQPGGIRSGAQGAKGTDGINGNAVGTASADGYIPSDGTAGTDGAPGKGGSGGNGRPTSAALDANNPSVPAESIWRGVGGAGGGAGGCPGLAGTPGKGGGASIAVLLLNSPTRFTHVELISSRGGDPGRGTLGSLPTPGGAGGSDPGALTLPKAGGAGGVPGISGNGSSGPSVGIMHTGPAPTIDATSTITPGTGGAAIAARVNISSSPSSGQSTLTRTIPATPAGISKGILAI